MPMFIQGLAGVSRRLWDGGIGYTFGEPVAYLNLIISYSAWILLLFQLPFVYNLFVSMRKGKKVDDNPWRATTLEWLAPSPPPHGNFAVTPSVYREPYEYSVPGQTEDFVPQHKSPEA